MKNFLFLFIICLSVACTKESTTTNDINNPNPNLSEIPEIDLKGVSATTVTASTDSLAFLIEYTDGDGDLGTNDPDDTVIELVDKRDSETLVFNYHLQPLAPPDSEIAITGELNIVLDHTIILDENNDSETTTFTIRLKDRAGNWSNVVETEMITIVR